MNSVQVQYWEHLENVRHNKVAEANQKYSADKTYAASKYSTDEQARQHNVDTGISAVSTVLTTIAIAFVAGLAL